MTGNRPSRLRTWLAGIAIALVVLAVLMFSSPSFDNVGAVDDRPDLGDAPAATKQ